MTQPLRLGSLALFSCFLAGARPAAAFEAPSLVSPGSNLPGAASASPCPVFSWSAPEHVGELQLRVVDRSLRRPQAADDTAESDTELDAVVFEVRLPAGARSFTPSLDDCFQEGGAFEWSVRLLHDGASADPSAWARPLRFAVRPTPSARTIDRLLARVDRADDGRDQPSAAPRTTAREESSARSPAAGLGGTPPLVRVGGRLQTDQLSVVYADPDTRGAIQLVSSSGASRVAGEMTAGFLRLNSSPDTDLADPSDTEVVLQQSSGLLEVKDPTAGNARGDLAAGTVKVTQLIVEGPIVTERSGLVGEGGSGYFRHQVRNEITDPTVSIDPNEQLCEICSSSACSSAVVVGARLFQAGGDQIGLQVLCGAPK